MALSINEDDEMLEDIMENGNQDDNNDDIPEEETSFIPIPKSSGRPPRLKRQVKFLKLASDYSSIGSLLYPTFTFLYDPIHMPLMDRPSVKYFLHKTFLFFIRIL